jgi:hypothetical protein
MNYLALSDAYRISQALTDTGNIYGLSSSNADSHLIKNSEWGAVAYLSQSQYGLNGTNIAINNVSLNGDSTSKTIWAVTGCASTAENASDAGQVVTTIAELNAGTTANVATWTQKAGTAASSTGTIYGIYDLSGGLAERTASYVADGNKNLELYGNSIIISETNRKYVMAYKSADSEITNNDDAAIKNYEVNSVIGDAISETSTAATGSSSWYNDTSSFGGYTKGYIIRGGRWEHTSSAGLFSYVSTDGNGFSGGGFRTVLVAK